MGEPHRAAGGSPKPMRTSRRERHRFREFTLATVGLWPTSRCTASTARSGSPSWSGRTTSPPPCRTPCATAGSVTPTCSPGPRGTGKTTTARLLAKALNCTNRGDDGDPCGVCESCVAIAEGSSLDVIEVDAASKSRVEEMRDLLERVAYLSAGGAKKVYILDEVHMLSAQRGGGAAQDARGVARARGVRAGDHRSAQGRADDPFPNAALRVHPLHGRRARRRISPTSARRKGSTPIARHSRSSRAPAPARCATRSRCSTRRSPTAGSTSSR